MGVQSEAKIIKKQKKMQSYVECVVQKSDGIALTTRLDSGADVRASQQIVPSEIYFEWGSQTAVGEILCVRNHILWVGFRDSPDSEHRAHGIWLCSTISLVSVSVLKMLCAIN